MDDKIKEKAIDLRHKLHMYPELSNCEAGTKKMLMTFLRENTSLEIIDCHSWFYAKYTAPNRKKAAIAFRADMDAIKVFEDNSLPYASKNSGVAHKCGHDGHSSALCAFALEVEQTGADRDIYFIFQHAEEDGSGAQQCCSIVQTRSIDEVYAVHNFPGQPFGSVCIKEGTVNLGSVGIEYTFTGMPTHASTPELGRNPAKAVSSMILAIDDITKKTEAGGLLLATVIQVELGERAFGVSASKGKLLLTVRGEHEQEMDAFIEELNETASRLCGEDGLTLDIMYYDKFTSTVNHPQSVKKIKDVCRQNNIPLVPLEHPIRTSEDFGYFTKKAKGALIWLGAGENWPALHSKDFDYNDALIEKTCELFCLLK